MKGLLSCQATAVTAPKLPSWHRGPSPFLGFIKPPHLPNKALSPHRLFASSHPGHRHLPSGNPLSSPLQRLRFAATAGEAASMSASTPSTAEPKLFSVLFVCLGNICRSPAAEAVFTDLVRKRGLEAKFRIDSAGTIGYHEGDPADSRMRAASKRRGIEVTSISRPIRPSDFREFDLILAMDMQNRDDILSAYERWRFKEPIAEDAPKKVRLMCSYCKKHTETEVPDPYYGGPQGFEKVLDLLEDACEALLDKILSENSHISIS